MEVKGTISNVKSFNTKKGTKMFRADFVAAEDSGIEMQCTLFGGALDGVTEGVYFVGITSLKINVNEWNGRVTISLEGKAGTVNKVA